jgi:hypothetical protein
VVIALGVGGSGTGVCNLNLTSHLLADTLNHISHSAGPFFMLGIFEMRSLRLASDQGPPDFYLPS